MQQVIKTKCSVKTRPLNELCDSEIKGSYNTN